MRRVMSFLLAGALMASMLVALTGCSAKDQKEIKVLMTEFQTACNELDFNGVLGCLNPKVADAVHAAVGVLGMFAQVDATEMFDGLSAYLSSSDLGGTDFFKSIKIDVEKVDVKDDAATVTATVRYTVSGKETSRQATFACIRYAEEWYISNLNFN